MDVVAVLYIAPFKSLSAFILIISAFFSRTSHADMPIYAAYVSDQLAQQCQLHKCQLDPLNGDKLSALAAQISNADELAESLALSDYEVLIGNALVNINGNQQAELVLEITTSWRQVPIDDIELKALINVNDLESSAQALLQEWAQHLEANEVLEADRIYQALKASDYINELDVPMHIGEFVLQASAVYRDPLLGSITRYVHPEFSGAVVDISVYPLSPFNSGSNENNAFQQIKFSDSNAELTQEMNNELMQIRQLITQADIQDYSISDIQTTEVVIGGMAVHGLRLEVLLNTNSDPVYSTQYVFKQNDKIIKLTGNVPVFMMSVLVNESLPQIKVPSESLFMRGLRQG